MGRLGNCIENTNLSFLQEKRSENSIVANVLKHRTGGIHIDACRIEGEKQTRDSNPEMNGGKYGQKKR